MFKKVKLVYDIDLTPPLFLRQKSRARKCSNFHSRSLRCLSSKMDDSGSDGCMTQRQYEIIVLFLSQGYFPTKRELMEAHFANGEDTIRPRPFRKFKSWTQRLLYRESENALIHLPTGKIVVPKERFVDIIVANHCNDTGGHLTAYATMRKVWVKFFRFLYTVFIGLGLDAVALLSGFIAISFGINLVQT